ncbi:cation channel family protein (macronuclear) [Tetrahymena thermophila SB210]|uniref:Cation channel family protein n=1 Tax=Tetrahymena thermophila (strain SB210) TaxID=312017 RepID=Q23FG9_TETTS|nr:cation channel family protein [Tetrahymena thermophila SB210]EAR95184.2 cation channel family protein [Tetrahymena thermophila SB210]|eukprot:XP_001015429.2 cation channel family protein [Tetrahymena thermophila SB210]
MIYDSIQINPEDKKQNSNIANDQTKNNQTENGTKISSQPNNLNQSTLITSNQVIRNDNHPNKQEYFDDKRHNSNHNQIDSKFDNQRYNSDERECNNLEKHSKDQEGIDKQNIYIKEQKSQNSTQRSNIQGLNQDMRQETYEQASSNKNLELEKTNRSQSKIMESIGLDSNRNNSSSNQFNRLTSNNNIQTNRNYDDSQNEENFNTGRSKNTENFSSKLEVELKQLNKGKKKQSKRDSLGLSAQEKALIEKMKLNTNQRNSQKSPLRNLIGKQIYEDQLGKTTKNNREEQNGTPQKRLSKIRYSNNSVTPIQMVNSPGQNASQRIQYKTPNQKSFNLEDSQISEQDKSIKSEIRNLRQRLNSKQQTSQDSQSDASSSERERSLDKNYIYNEQDEVEEEYNTRGVQGKMYQKVRDLLQQQLDEDGGQNQEDEEDELNQHEQQIIVPEDFIDQNTLDEYEKLTQEQEVRTQNQYLKTYKVQKKSALDKLGYLFYRPSIFLQVFKFFFYLKCAISDFCYKIIKSNWFENTILLIIIFNSIMLMLDDPTTDVQSSFADWCEQFFLWAYTVEACLKIIALGFILPQGAYLKDGWNILDFAIVVSSLLPLVIGSSTVNLRALRSLRILRPLRTISKVKKLKILLKTLFSAIPYLVNSMIILTFFFLIFAIGGLQLFGGLLLRRCLDPLSGIVADYNQVCGGGYQCDDIYICGKTMSNPQFNVTNFDDIFYSFLMVFQVITLEGWTQIMYQLFDAFSVFTVIYFVLLVFIGSFFLINLTLAVIKAKFSDNQGTTIVVQENEEEPEMTIDILREYRSLERHYLKTIDPLNDHLAKQRERLNIESFREEQQKRGFVWEDLAKLRMLQKQKQKENYLKEERLRKKLFVEQWRNKQKSKIQQATKKIAKFYRIIPQFQLLSAATPQQKSNNQIYALPIAEQSNEDKTNNQDQNIEQLNEQNATTQQINNNPISVSKNKIVPLENINLNGLALNNQTSQSMSEQQDQKIVQYHSQQNQYRNQVTFMGFQTNYFATMQKPLVLSQQLKLQQQLCSSNSSQQMLLNEDEEDHFWKEIEDQKNLFTNKENQKDSLSHKESDKQQTSSTSSQTNIQDKQNNNDNNNAKSKSRDDFIAQPSQEQLQQEILLSKQQDSAVKSILNKTDSTRSRESVLDHSSPKKFSILNLKSQKKSNSHSTKQKTEKPEAILKKFSISSQGSIMLESHNSIIEFQDQELSKQNSDQPLKLNLASTEGDEIQFTTRLQNVKSHINANHNVMSPMHQNLINFNSQSNDTPKNELQKQETKDMNDSLLNDSDFFQNPEKKQEQTENYEYLAQVLKNLNEKIANRLKNDSDEDNNYENRNDDFEDNDENQEDDFNLKRQNKFRGGATFKNNKQTFSKKPDYSPVVDKKDQNLEQKIRKGNDQDNFNKIIHEVEEEEDDEQKTNKNTERANNIQQFQDEQISPSNQQSSQKQKNIQHENGETQLNESNSQHQENKEEPIMDNNQNGNHNNQNKPALEISEYQKQRELLQIEWLKKIEKIRQEHKLIEASSSSQFFQLEVLEKRKKEKEEQELKEKMIKEVKNWKLMVDYKHEDEFTSKEDVMELTINQQLKNKEEEEEQRLRQLKYKILHKLKVVKKKKKLTKRQKRKQNLSRSIQNGNKASNDNSVRENSPHPNTSMRAKERIQKLKRLQQMISNAAMSKKSGLNQNSIFQADQSGIRRKNDSNTVKDFKDNKSVITFSKFAGFQSPQASVKGDNKGKAYQGAFQRFNKSFNSTNSIGSVQDDVHRLKIPIKMSNRIICFDQFSSHQGDDLSVSEAQSGSVSNQNNNQSNSLTVRNTKFIISQTKKKRERIKKELLQEQNVKNNEKINYSNYNQVVHAINAPIKKQKNEQNEIQDNFDFKNEYLDQLREDALTGIKTKQIFSGIDVLRGYRGGALRLNKVLRPLNSDRQEIKMWIPGILGILIVIHKHINHFVKSSFFNNLATIAVFANTVVLALAGSFSDDQSNQILDWLNNFFTFVFIGEMAFKIIGLTPAGYVRDRMNIFDGFIVCLSILELVIFSGSGSKAFSAFRSVRIFRTFRVLRVTRLLRGLEFMGVIIKVISRTLDSFIYIAFLLFLFIFIFTLLGMQIYGGKLQIIDPRVRQNFDNFQNGFITVFQLMTIENWNDILYKTFNSSVNKFLTSIYLIVWIFIGNWIFLNLFLAILLDGFTDQSQEDSLALEDEDQYEEEVVDKNENKNQQFNQLNQENLQILNEDFERMDSEEMELIEQEILQLEGKSQNQQLFIGIECSHSLYLFSKQNSIRILFYKIVKHPQFENLILFFIVTSSLKLVVDTYVDEHSDVGIALKNVDLMFNFIFIAEATLKIISFGFIGDENSYLDESWSQIDFFIVCTSIIDMTFSGVNVSFIKILRLLRTLRPLRFISHNVNMKVVVIALFESISGIFNILIVIFLIWIMFAILGISLIGNRMGYCSGISYIYHVNQDRCQSMGYQWQTYDTNFDNILNAMRTLYIISSLEGWPDLMYQAIDSNTADVGPVKDNYIQISYFYMIFILVGSFFLINLFVGVIFLNFNEAQKNERQSSLFLTEEQKRWIEFQQMIIGVKAEFAQSVVPTQKIPKLMYNIVTNQKFEIFIMVLIVCNILTMAMAYEGSPSSYDSILENINLFFTSCFILETIMKFIAFGIKGFFANDWNKFDLFVVVSSIVDIILNYSGALSASFLRIGPQLIRIIRVFRVSRLLKLVKSMKGLQKLIETLMFSLPSLINVGALLLLVFFIYSILGVFMFKDVTEGVVIDKYNNFENFGNAMITLFRCSTGENWYQFMFDCGKTSGCVQGKDCGSPFSTLFFISFVLICSFIMLNLFILIIIQYFEDYHMKEDNPLQAFNDKLNIFRITWSKYTKKTLGEKINSKDIVDFLYELPLPLGYHDPDPNAATAHPVAKKEIARQVMNWALVQQMGEDQQEYVFFNDMLFACMKKEYGSKLMQNAGPELMKMLNKLEVETRLKIAEKKKKQILKKNKKVFGGHHQKGQKKANPMIAFMFLQMSFKAWQNYSVEKTAKGIVDGQQEEKSSSSSSEESFSSEEEEELNNEEIQNNEEDQNNKQDINNGEIEKQSVQSASRKKSEFGLRDKFSRKGTYISKTNSQNKQDLKNDILNKNKHQQSSKLQLSSSSSSSQSSNSESNSSSDDSSSSSSSQSRPNSKEKKSQTHSKIFDKQFSKKGNKSIVFDQISEKEDKEEQSPNQKRNQDSRKLRRIDTLNLKKLDTEFEFGQTNKYQYSANQNQNKLVNANKVQFSKQANTSIEMLSKNSIFNLKNKPTDQNKLQKQTSLKNYF